MIAERTASETFVPSEVSSARARRVASSGRTAIISDMAQL